MTALIVSLPLWAGEKPNPDGTWKWTVPGRDGQSRESTLTLRLESEKLKGSIKGARNEIDIQEGKLEGNEISFKVTRETQQRGTMTTAYKGKIEGDVIKGTMTTKTEDRTNEREWVAKREGGADLTGDWAWSMKRDNGETWEATLKLKTEAGKITGRFERDGNPIEIQEAKLAGDTLTFQTAIERDGQTMIIKNTAVIAGKTMKGKAEGTRDGQAWSREWEASRK